MSKLMNLKYIFLPKPASQESTILRRLGMVIYLIGVIWLFGFGFLWMQELNTSLGKVIERSHVTFTPEQEEVIANAKARRKMAESQRMVNIKRLEAGIIVAHEAGEVEDQKILEKELRRLQALGLQQPENDSFFERGDSFNPYLAVAFFGFFLSRSMFFILANR